MRMHLCDYEVLLAESSLKLLYRLNTHKIRVVSVTAEGGRPEDNLLTLCLGVLTVEIGYTAFVPFFVKENITSADTESSYNAFVKMRCLCENLLEGRSTYC